jgi:hypothetical protein
VGEGVRCRSYPVLRSISSRSEVIMPTRFPRFDARDPTDVWIHSNDGAFGPRPITARMRFASCSRRSAGESQMMLFKWRMSK